MIWNSSFATCNPAKIITANWVTFATELFSTFIMLWISRQPSFDEWFHLNSSSRVARCASIVLRGLNCGYYFGLSKRFESSSSSWFISYPFMGMVE